MYGYCERVLLYLLVRIQREACETGDAISFPEVAKIFVARSYSNLGVKRAFKNMPCKYAAECLLLGWNYRCSLHFVRKVYTS